MEQELANRRNRVRIDPKRCGDAVTLKVGTVVGGHGAAIATSALEQDASYWEIKVVAAGGGENDSRCQVGVSKRLDRTRLGRRLGVENESWVFDALVAQTLQRGRTDDGSDDEGCKTNDGPAATAARNIDGSNEVDPDAAGAAKSTPVAAAVASAGGEIVVREGDVIGMTFSHSDVPMLTMSLNGVPVPGATAKRVRGTAYPACHVSGGAVLQFAFTEDNFQHTPPNPKFGAIVPAASLI